MDMPVVTASNFTATHNQNIAASNLFSVTDANGDSITQYQLWDSTGDPASGHWIVNGVVQGSNVAIDVTAAQLASTTFQSGSGSDDLWVRANDGTAWGAWKEFHVNAPLDHAPVATASDFIATHNQNIAASSLFSATDADGDTITNYQFWDSTADPASGHWIVGGVTQGTNVAIDVTAAQLASATFQSGSGSDDLYVRANDGIAWGAWKEFHVNAPVDHAPVDHAPVATAADFTAFHNQNILASSLFSVTDADGDFIAKYQVWDSTSDPSSGYWAINGVAQGSNVAIDVTAAQLAITTFQTGSGSDDLWVRANDGTAWGAWKEFHINAPVDHAPVAVASDFTAFHNQNILASSLFSATDVDGDFIAKYQVFDSTSDPSSGHWSINAVVRGANIAIDVTAAQLASTTFQSGSGSDDLWVRASDGFLWSDWKEFHVNAPIDNAPVVTTGKFTAFHNQNILASSLFSATDVDGDFIAKYQVFDSTSDPSSGHWSVNEVVQGTNVAIDVTAAQLASTTFQSGSGADQLYVRASDGMLWSAWQAFTVTAPVVPNLAEYVTVSNTALSAGASTTVTAIDINLGAIAALGSTAGIYLSTDSTITRADTLLTTVTSPGLAAVGQSRYYDLQNVQLTLPDDLAPGSYFIGGIADHGNAIDESNETDNTYNTVTITVGKSNLAEYVTLSNTALSAGASTTVSAYDINLGAFAAPGSTAGIYLSADSIITGADTLLTTVTSPGLAAVGQSGYYDLHNVQVTLPGNLAPGTYFIGGIADSANAVAESSETDNTYNTVAITVGRPDLTAYVAASSSTAAAGVSTTITLYDINLGTFAAAASHTSFYLSTDATITTSDTLLKTVNAPGLAPVGQTGYYDVQSITVTPPANLTPGTYYIGAISNSDGQVAETNSANNNYNAVQITVGAAPQNGSSPINIASGATVEIAGASAQPVSFAGSTGTLILDNPSSFSGTVAGLAGQDTLDLVDVSFATLQQQPSFTGTPGDPSSGGTLSVTDGSQTVNIALLGNYLASTFVASSDGHGGTAIIDPPAGQDNLLTPAQHA